MQHVYPKVAIVGRMNVGKSTLFNKLSDTSRALISPIPGTTRDLNYAKVIWRDKNFELIDMGGLDVEKKSDIEDSILKMADKAIKMADLIILLIDGKNELSALDRKFAKFLKQSEKKTLLVINKIDSLYLRRQISPDFYKLGLGEPLIISALTGIGTGDLLDEIIKHAGSKFNVQSSEPDIKLSIIGKTNVGKSSILNAIINEERVIVTPLPHTTREPQDTLIKYKNKNIMLVDTAGLRKKGKMADRIEEASASKTLEVIKDSDVSLFITDVSQPLSVQDQKIADLALQNHNGIMIVANKWDLITNKTPRTFGKFIDYYQNYFPYLWWAPIIFVSALEKQRMHKLIELALEVQKERQKIVEQEKLNQFISKLTRKAKFKLSHLSQIGTNPPQFLFKANYKQALPQSYLKFIERRLREEFGFNGTPIIIKLSQPKGKKI